MKNVTVITGGAGGMGLATARLMGSDHYVVISDVSQARLDQAIAGLRELGIECDAVQCDITDAQAVEALIRHAAGKGRLASVIHTAGISPQMAGPEAIMTVNALGTVNVANACLPFAGDGFALVNVASMAAHMFPDAMVPVRAYALALTDREAFLKKTLFLTRFMPNQLLRRGTAYGISKNFVIWYTKRMAGRFGAVGARIVSVSPGSFDTEMGRLEEKSGSAKMLETAALKRFGTPEEIAALLAFCASDKAGYLTGTDILCDGGVVAGRQHRNSMRQDDMQKTIYDFSATDIQGQERPLADYRGKVMLITNTASRCGFTPQFGGLEQLYQKYADRGLVVLGFPCNQFLHQDSGSNSEIATFCQRNYGVSFPMYAKIDVNGRNAHPLFQFLKEKAPGVWGSRQVKWNFTKFLVDRNGNVVRRYAPKVTPEEIEGDIVKLL